MKTIKELQVSSYNERGCRQRVSSEKKKAFYEENY